METVLGLGSPEFGAQIDTARLGHLQHNVINILMEKNCNIQWESMLHES